MVKTPKTRHSKVRRDPVTIDLGPEEISRIEESKPAAEEFAAGPVPVSETATASNEALLDEVSANEALGDEASGKEAWASEAGAEERPTEPETASQQALDDDLKAKTDAQPRYASGFGRSPGDELEPAEAPVRSAGRGTSLLAGLIGGVIALAGAGALQFAEVLPAPRTGGEGVAGLQTEIGALREEIQELKNGSSAAGVEELRQALGDSAARIDGLSTTVVQLGSDLAALRSAVGAGGAGDGAAMQALDQKIKEIEAAVAALGGNGGAASSAALDAITRKIASVESALGAATTAAAAVDSRLAALEQGVASLSEKVEAQADQPRVALAIAASALKAAVDRGGPFAAEVETFAAVAPNAPELAELRALAEKGVPSRADLVAAAPDAATAMIEASKSVDANAGFFERLLASAESLIKVRPIGAVEGEGVPEKVARLEAALKDGNLAKTLAEYDTLPEPSKAAGAAFAETIRTRLKAEELVDKALAGALKAA